MNRITILSLLTAALLTPVARAGDLELKLWADENLMASPVAISVDDQGRAYVTQTTRRKSSDLDIRKHGNWVTDELSFTHTDEHRAFLHRVLDPANSDQNKWLEDFNKDGKRDWTDLKVQEERIIRLVDTNGDGVADKVTDYARFGKEDEMTGTCAGVLWHDGNVYVTCMPRLWKLRDTNDDGMADERNELVYGVGVHVAYGGHDIHGLTVGPDGRIYWSLGDTGAHVKLPDGRSLKYPNQGLVMRCEPDGSNVEVFAHGLRNPQELAFDEYGNLFSVDNDSDKGDKERFVYITEGSDTGWRINWQFNVKTDYNPWMDEKLWVPHFEGQAAYITPAICNYNNGPCGFAYNPGGALNDKYQRTFFLTEFPGKTLSAFRTEPDGSSFKMVDSRTVAKGQNFVGVSWGPDGALWLADWSGGGWDPSDKGRVWRLDDWSVAGSAERKSIAGLLGADPSKKPADELATLLGHTDQRVRLKAQFELARRGDLDTLARVANDAKAPQLARVHAIWGVGQIGRRDAKAIAKVAPLLKDTDRALRVQVMKVAGDAHYDAAAGDIAAQINDGDPRVRFFAALTAGKLGAKSDVDALVKMLADNDDKDTQLRHAGVMGLVGTGDKAALVALKDHASRAVRLAAVVALRRLAEPGVAAYLDDKDELVAAEAARAIHDDWSIPAALPALAAVVDQPGRKDEALLRRAINANLRVGGDAELERLLRYALRTEAPSAMRGEALATVAAWVDDYPIDRVDRRYRPRPARAPAAVHKALNKVAGDLAKVTDDKLRTEVARLAGAVAYHGLGDALFAWVKDGKASPTTRMESLRALAAMHHAHAGDAVEVAMNDKDKNVRKTAQSLLKSAGKGGDAVATLSKVLDKGSMEERQGAFTTLASIGDAKADAVLATWMDRLLEGNVDPALQLDLLDAARSAGEHAPTLAEKVTKYEESLEKDDPLAAFRIAMQGGDAANGKVIFETHIAAQCIRCHSVAGKGGNVAPDLAKVAAQPNKDRHYFLESLITPQAVVVEGYGTVALILNDGSVVSGAIRGEKDGKIEVLKPDGKTQFVEASKVKSKTPPVSSMPPMGAILKPRELRDVIEYLSTLK